MVRPGVSCHSLLEHCLEWIQHGDCRQCVGRPRMITSFTREEAARTKCFEPWAMQNAGTLCVILQFWDLLTDEQHSFENVAAVASEEFQIINV